MNRLHALSVAFALAVPTLAFAQFDDGEEDISTSMDISAKMPGVPGMNIRIDVNEGSRPGKQSPKATKREEISSSKPGETFKLVYESDPSGKTSLRILAPEKFVAVIYEDGTQRFHDSIPMSQNLIGGKFYAIQILRGGKVAFEKKIEARG